MKKLFYLNIFMAFFFTQQVLANSNIPEFPIKAAFTFRDGSTSEIACIKTNTDCVFTISLTPKHVSSAHRC
jgi:hypothetical protein